MLGRRGGIRGAEEGEEVGEEGGIAVEESSVVSVGAGGERAGGSLKAAAPHVDPHPSRSHLPLHLLLSSSSLSASFMLELRDQRRVQDGLCQSFIKKEKRVEDETRGEQSPKPSCLPLTRLILILV